MDVCGFVFGPKTTSYIGNFVENNIIQTRTLSPQCQSLIGEALQTKLFIYKFLEIYLLY